MASIARSLQVPAIVVAGFCSAAGQAPSTTPNYCVNLSRDQCDQVSRAIQIHERPGYCVPGYGLVDSGLNDVQRRICDLQPLPPPQAAEEREASKWAQAQHRRIEDARAAVKESWDGHGLAIEQIEIGYRCQLYDQQSAEVALQSLESIMSDEQTLAGLIDDESLNLQAYVATHVRAGKAAAENGACEKLSPADRGRLRQLAIALADAG